MEVHKAKKKSNKINVWCEEALLKQASAQADVDFRQKIKSNEDFH